MTQPKLSLLSNQQVAERNGVPAHRARVVRPPIAWGRLVAALALGFLLGVLAATAVR